MGVLHFADTAPAGVWLVTAVLALSSFLFLVGYLFLLYPDPATSSPLSSPTEANMATDFSRALQRLIGPGGGGGGALNDSDVPKLRPFRAVGFLLLTVPTAYIKYTRKMDEENLKAIQK